MPELQDPAGLRALQQPNTTFIDQRSRPEFGPQTIGLETEADRRQITIVGQYSLGGGFAADGTLIMSDQNFRRYFDPRPLNQVNLGLILLEPKASPQRVKAAITQRLPADVNVYTKSEVIQRGKPLLDSNHLHRLYLQPGGSGILHRRHRHRLPDSLHRHPRSSQGIRHSQSHRLRQSISLQKLSFRRPPSWPSWVTYPDSSWLSVSMSWP